MKTKHATNRLNEIKAHNARVGTIRNKSLSDEAVSAIDTMIAKADYFYGDIMECLLNGVQPVFTTSELIEFSNAVDELRKQFTEIEPSEYLLEAAAEEAEQDDEDDV